MTFRLFPGPDFWFLELLDCDLIRTSATLSVKVARLRA
jgi:hypothetical protein